jgi:hypothetical protein
MVVCADSHYPMAGVVGGTSLALAPIFRLFLIVFPGPVDYRPVMGASGLIASGNLAQHGLHSLED